MAHMVQFEREMIEVDHATIEGRFVSPNLVKL